jgi:hypothetical protein
MIHPQNSRTISASVFLDHSSKQHILFEVYCLLRRKVVFGTGIQYILKKRLISAFKEEGLLFHPPSTVTMEAAVSSETLVVYQNTQCHIPEDSVLHSHCHGNLKSRSAYIYFIFRLLSFTVYKTSAYLDVHIREDEMCKVCITHETEVKCIQEFWWEGLRNTALGRQRHR